MQWCTAQAVGVLSKLVKPDVADVDPRADAAAAAAAAAGAAATAGVALSAQAAHPHSQMQQVSVSSCTAATLECSWSCVLSWTT
jgi:hypothetical protein